MLSMVLVVLVATAAVSGAPSQTLPVEGVDGRTNEIVAASMALLEGMRDFSAQNQNQDQGLDTEAFIGTFISPVKRILEARPSLRSDLPSDAQEEDNLERLNQAENIVRAAMNALAQIQTTQ